MSNKIELPPIANDELLARFVLFSDWIRHDQTVRPNAFIPHPYPNLSVIRHRELYIPGESTTAGLRPACS